MQAVVPRFVAKKLCGFFHDPEANLDVGFALPLQAKAKAAGPEDMAAVRWLCRPDVQQNLELWVERTTASNLDGERRFAQAKRSTRGVGPVRNLASAARDHMHDRFLMWRQEECDRHAAKGAEQRRTLRRNSESFAWQAVMRKHRSTTPFQQCN